MNGRLQVHHCQVTSLWHEINLQLKLVSQNNGHDFLNPFFGKSVIPFSSLFNKKFCEISQLFVDFYTFHKKVIWE